MLGNLISRNVSAERDTKKNMHPSLSDYTRGEISTSIKRVVRVVIFIFIFLTKHVGGRGMLREN